MVILLLIYKELSVNDLCKIMNKSWPTISGHLTALEEAGLLNVRKVKVRGPKDKKLYSVNTEILAELRIDYGKLRNVSSEEVIDILSRELKGDAWTMRFIKKLIDDLIPYFGAIEKKLNDTGYSDSEKLIEFYNEHKANHYIESLDEDEYAFYLQRYEKLHRELIEFRNKRVIEGKSIISSRPYGTLHVILPLKKIQEINYNLYWLEKDE